ILNVGYAVHNADWNWADVSSPFARIYYVTAGSAAIEIGGRRVPLEPGRMYIIPPFVRHSDICDGHFEHYYIHVYEDPSSPVHVLEDWTFPVSLEAVDRELELFERLHRLNPHMRLLHSAPSSYDDSRGLSMSLRRNKNRSLCVRIESRGLLYQLIARFLAEAKPREEHTDQRIRNAIRYIRRNISKPIDLDDLIEFSCMSKDHFIRTFRREIGVTPMRYVIERKMEHAQLLLATGDMPVKSVAYAAGYDDHSYFNRLFRKEVGMTPLQYRADRKV
ncbi:MAG: AraC family transcriptional regulator, partial [Duncaniella sp.]|nr:AraC family transcriptional regulator [Duncaniella sp.]